MNPKLNNYLTELDSIRECCNNIFSFANSGELPNFNLHADKLPELIQYAEAVSIGKTHSRMDHFLTGNVNRIKIFLDQKNLNDLIELVILSVLIDAGAGTKWVYNDSLSGKSLQFSEGLAAASFNLYMQGFFANSQVLSDINTQSLAYALQVTDTNPIVALSGRVHILHKVGTALAQKPKYFSNGKLSDILVFWRDKSKDGCIPMPVIFASLLDAFEL